MAYRCLLSAVLSLTAVSAAHADGPTRLGLFVGSNLAPVGREPLKHAEADAARMRQVFVELGEMRDRDARVLTSPSADDVLSAINDLAEAARKEQDALVVFYYSGHADDRALLLGGSELTVPRLKAALDAVPARLSLQFIDACRSGALTRRKGATLGQPFSVNTTPIGEGRVVITSSAEYEDSQESDRLGGSFFTLHLTSGLRGAADADLDGTITLAESYAYVYGRTVESTLATVAGPQHPTFLYDIQGRGDFVLTWPKGGDQAALVRLTPGGDYLVVDTNSGRVVAEVRPRDTGERLALRAGQYRISKRTQRTLREGTVSLRPGDEIEADAQMTTETAHARLVRKGGGPTSAHAIWIDGGYRGPIGSGIDASPMLRISYALTFPWLTIRPHFGVGGLFGADPVTTPRLSYDVREMTAGLELRREYDFNFLTLSGGVLADVLFLRQREQAAQEAERNTTGFVFGGVLGVATAPWNGFSLMVAGELDVYGFLASEADRAPASQGELTTTLTYRTWLSLGYAL